MVLENLLILIEKLRGRIDRHGDALRQSEALTRYALIDPLLRELGWDTEDPDVVVPEYSSGGGRVDYALCKNGKSVIMLEAKKLDTPLNDAIGQGIQYCLVGGRPQGGAPTWHWQWAKNFSPLQFITLTLRV